MDTSRVPADKLPLVSYSQNHEDVLLWRAFRELETGFYVDVGANSPSDSITALFSHRGWTGINVEPVTSWFELLQSERPHDVNLNICISDSDAPVDLTEVVDTGLSTADPELARGHAGSWETRPIRRPGRTLADVLAEHAPADIHFLSIDVEGMESRVLAGADFDAHRPRVVIVESVHPISHEPTHEDWEPILLEADYELLLFDGVNRFYGSAEHIAELRPHFRTPPNSTDDFVSRVERDATRLGQERGDALHELSQLHHRTHEEMGTLHQRLLDQMERADDLERRAIRAESQLAQLSASISWRLTSPLRTVAARARSLSALRARR